MRRLEGHRGRLGDLGRRRFLAFLAGVGWAMICTGLLALGSLPGRSRVSAVPRCTTNASAFSRALVLLWLVAMVMFARI